MNLSELSGKLNIKVRWQQGCIQQVLLSSSRPLQLPKLFFGKRIEDVVELIPRLYSLCAVAQKIAALKAVESALQLPTSESVERVRGLLIMAETARELSLRLFSDWLPDEANTKAGVMQWFSQLQSDYQWALEINPEVEKLPDFNACAASLQAILTQALGQVINAQGDSAQRQQLLSYFEGGLLCLLDGGLGVQISKPSPVLDFNQSETQGDIVKQLQGEGAESFCAFPQLHGRTYENSAFSLSSDSKLLNKNIKNNIYNRLINLIESLFSLPEKILNRSNDCLIQSQHKGVGMVQAARGVLIHRVVLEGAAIVSAEQQNTKDTKGTGTGILEKSCVKDYKIVAPTEWNFHPQGTLVSMLQGARVAKEQLALVVGSLVKLVDPCVDWQLDLDIAHA